mmetsp:Transcript_58855/g.166037  ORF Transcript_58855/g.166037 Transcript_58855/m.166037 type:complete len:393 (-) Transcript_58855:21-1199(-)
MAAAPPPKRQRGPDAPASLESVRYDAAAKTLEVLDQLKLPLASSYIAVPDAEAAWQAIKKMQIRGAPLIGIVAALGLAAEAHARGAGSFADAAAAAEWLRERLAYLKTARPTAVNLSNYAAQAAGSASGAAARAGATASSVLAGYIAGAEQLLRDDLRDNMAIGENGAGAVLGACKRGSVRVLTICNTGSLATAGHGTALGIVRSLHARGALERVYACETRPYNQGARLTAYEILADNLPGTLICDSMAGLLMAQGGVDAVVVGCDRVCANGDFANKIGTYSLAVLAHHHGVPFFVAGTSGTVDLGMASGDAIPIEHRPAHELTQVSAATEDGGMVTLQVAPHGVEAWNPAFDVTPARLVRGLVTEHGVAERGEGEEAFDLRAHVGAAAGSS